VSLDTIRQQLAMARRSVDRETGEARALALRGKAVQSELAEAKELKETLAQAVGVLTGIGEARQEEAQRRIESLVTYGLRTVFEDELSFHLVQTVSRNAANVDFVVRTTLADGEQIDTPVMDARGGGLVAVVGFMLRLVIMLLAPDRQSPILFLDEPFAHLSAEYEPRMASFLRELVDKTDIQIVHITHSDAYTDDADLVYRFSLKDGQTHVSNA
jgi:DNA repair exonuclease SbcCD ATPase subunit